MLKDQDGSNGTVTLRAMSGAQKIVLEYMRGVKPCRVLDMPCGEGAFSQKIHQAGFDVECCDIDPGLFKLEGKECKKVNLNRDTLPYESESFDIVASIGGLHRLFNPQNAISEASRVLVPGGRLIIGLVNYSSLKRRLLFLFKGLHAANIVAQRCRQTIDDPEANFRFPLTVPHLFQLLRDEGLEIRKVRADRWANRAVLLLPLVALIGIMSLIGGTKYEKKFDLRGTGSLPVLMSRRYILVVAEKKAFREA